MANRQIHKRTALVFGPLGYCMYGPDHNKSDLSREHVMPRGLGGGTIILKSSCASCRKITRDFEAACLSDGWKYFRALNGFDFSDPQRKPTHGPASFTNHAGTTKKLVPLRERPNPLTLPVVEEIAGIITGENERPAVKFKYFISPMDKYLETSPLGENLEIEIDFDSAPFFQLLAKIAHGTMFIHYETANIRPLLLDVILGTDIPNFWRFIGSGPSMDFATPENSSYPGLGAHGVRCFSGKLVRDGYYYVFVDLCLFGSIQGVSLPVPTYRIVAGRCDVKPTRAKWKRN